MDFYVGAKVLCRNFHSAYLSKGKIYEVFSITYYGEEPILQVRNDIGDLKFYHYSRFDLVLSELDTKSLVIAKIKQIDAKRKALGYKY